MPLLPLLLVHKLISPFTWRPVCTCMSMTQATSSKVPCPPLYVCDPVLWAPPSLVLADLRTPKKSGGGYSFLKCFLA